MYYQGMEKQQCHEEEKGARRHVKQGARFRSAIKELEDRSPINNINVGSYGRGKAGCEVGECTERGSSGSDYCIHFFFFLFLVYACLRKFRELIESVTCSCVSMFCVRTFIVCQIVPYPRAFYFLLLGAAGV